jgi:hypothetical protein
MMTSVAFISFHMIPAAPSLLTGYCYVYHNLNKAHIRRTWLPWYAAARFSASRYVSFLGGPSSQPFYVAFDSIKIGAGRRSPVHVRTSAFRSLSVNDLITCIASVVESYPWPNGPHEHHVHISLTAPLSCDRKAYAKRYCCVTVWRCASPDVEF